MRRKGIINNRSQWYGKETCKHEKALQSNIDSDKMNKIDKAFIIMSLGLSEFLVNEGILFMCYRHYK